MFEGVPYVCHTRFFFFFCFFNTTSLVYGGLSAKIRIHNIFLKGVLLLWTVEEGVPFN